MIIPDGYLVFTTLMGDVYIIEHAVYEEEIALYNEAQELGDEATVEKLVNGGTGWIYIPESMRNE